MVVILLDTSILLDHRLNRIGGVIEPSFIEIVPTNVGVKKGRGGIDFMVFIY